MAFLKGLTFEEVQQIRGGEKREVCMDLPKPKSDTLPSGSGLIRQLDGYKDFNPSQECP